MSDPIDRANKLTDLALDHTRDELEQEVGRIPERLLRPTMVELAAMRAADLQRAARAEGQHFTATMAAVEETEHRYRAKLLEQGQALARERRKVKDLITGLDVPTIEARRRWLKFWRRR